MTREALDLFKFESYGACLDRIASPPVNPNNRARWNEDYGPDGGMIYHAIGGSRKTAYHHGGMPHKEIVNEQGKVTVQKVVAWLKRGWPNGVQELHDKLGTIKLPDLTDVRRRGKWRDNGDTLSLDRMMEGNERCWRTTRRGTIFQPPPLQIIADVSVNCGSDGRFWRGACAAAFAEAAAIAGYRLCIDAVVNITGLSQSGAGFLVITRIKHYDQPVNLGACITMLAHPASADLMDFGNCIQIPENMMGWGRVACIGLDRIKRFNSIDDRAVPLLVPSYIGNKASAMEWIKQTSDELEQRAADGFAML